MYIFSQLLIPLIIAALIGAWIARALGLCNCNNDELTAELNGARAERDELAARLSANTGTGRDDARIASLEAELAAARNSAPVALAGTGISSSDHETLKARNSFLEARVKFLEDGAAKPAPAPKAELKVSAAGAMSADELESAVIAAGEGKKPKAAARGKDADDLLLIDGVGPKNNEWLHENGIHYFAQIAAMGPAELAWLANNIPNFGSRVYRENWVAQCANLAKGLPAR